MNKRIVVAGKGHIACEALAWLLANYSMELIVLLPSIGDVSEPQKWPSVTKLANRSNVKIISNLNDFKTDKDVILLSLEYDKIIDIQNFTSKALYNMHFSALPKYRGVYTSTWPILNGETHSGVTLHKIDSGIDTGPIVAQETFEISNSLTAFDLYNFYQKKASELIISWLPKIVSGDEIVADPQVGNGSYYDRKSIDFTSFTCDFFRNALDVHNNFRAFIFPRFQFPKFQNHEIIKSEITETASLLQPGTVVKSNPGFFEVCTLDFNVILYTSTHQD
jgi:methionyl-tRNA formyltransferase